MRILISSALLFLVACNSADKTDQKENVQVAGAWKMLSQNLKGEKTDTTYTTIQQLKIFTGDHMMYANVNPADSVSSFGVGSYSSSADSISEIVIYSSSDTTNDEASHTYKLAIEKTDKGYKQVIPDIANLAGEHFKLSEEYEAAGADTKSPLDGLWKLTKYVTVNGKDTAAQLITQYKAYQGGQVIWGHTVTDSLKKMHTGIGFGKFEMSGDTKAKETMVASTYSVVRGRSFDIDIAMNGNDAFTQTITNPDGSKEIESYQRVRK